MLTAYAKTHMVHFGLGFDSRRQHYFWFLVAGHQTDTTTLIIDQVFRRILNNRLADLCKKTQKILDIDNWPSIYADKYYFSANFRKSTVVRIWCNCEECGNVSDISSKMYN